MSLVQPSGLRAEPLVCSSCGERVLLPVRDEALLDERGWAQVPCSCGRVNVVPYDTVELQPIKKRRRASWQVAALWIVILALLILLLPVAKREQAPEPQPPLYLTT